MIIIRSMIIPLTVEATPKVCLQLPCVFKKQNEIFNGTHSAYATHKSTTGTNHIPTAIQACLLQLGYFPFSV